MKHLLLLWACMTTLIAGAQVDCTGRFIQDIADSVVVETVQYGEARNKQGTLVPLSMDIYQSYQDNGIDRPVMILAFGGSFISGSRKSEDMVHFATEFAKKGYVTAAIDYRLASAFDLLQEEELVKEVFRAVQDGKAAIRFFRRDAAESNTYRVNPNAIFVGGTSAGAILGINLTYADRLEKLPMQWQNWLNELEGGLEGESGNPGYCSKPDGVFSFAGAVGDTAWIDPDDVPIYSTHSTGDETVLYGYGKPLGGAAPVSLYGSGLIHERMDNLGTHNRLDTYNDNAHPPFNVSDEQEQAQRLADIEDHLTGFLFEIMACNPNNQLPDPADRCSGVSQVAAVANENNLHVFPNPANDVLNIVAGIRGNARILNINGQVVREAMVTSPGNVTLDISGLNPGVYILEYHGSHQKLMIAR